MKPPQTPGWFNRGVALVLGGADPVFTAERTCTMTADIWGFCAICDRWFFCEDWFDKQAPQPCCPVCSAEPSAIENRSAPDQSFAGGGNS